MTNEEFLLFKSLIYNESGMYFKDTKKEFIQSRISKRLKAANIRTYISITSISLTMTRGKRGLLILLDALTIGGPLFQKQAPV